MKKLLVFILSAIMLFSLSSCQTTTNKTEETTITEQIPIENTENFDTVELFKIAIKKDPAKYNGKRIAIKAYAYPLLSLSSVYLFDNIPANNERWDDRPRVKVVVTDSLKLSVLENGDYVELNGVVTITSEEIYLDHCTYTMLKTNEEQNTK